MGGQKGIALFYKYLSGRVHLKCLTTSNNQPSESYEVLPAIPFKPWRYFWPLLFFRLKALAAQSNRTHLLFEHPYYAWLIVLCKLFLPYRIIVHSHNIEAERFKSIGKWWWRGLALYEKLAYRMADVLWFKTEEDRHYAVLYYKVREEKCYVIPYGVEAERLGESGEYQRCKQTLLQQYQLSNDTHLLLFNGTLNYKPNLDALILILDQIEPLLRSRLKNYRILVCGKGLPELIKQRMDTNTSRVLYAGFVDDIDLYFKGCDLFLNPLQDGGGIKTKLVEALGFGTKCVSSVNGAIGVDPALCGGRLQIVADKDWEGYGRAIEHLLQTPIENANLDFYQVYSWPSIAEKAAGTLRIG